jgi:hypothetical protein
MKNKIKTFLKKVKTLLLSHPEEVDEGYFTHFGYAISYSFAFACGALACLIHAFLPFLFKKAAQNVAGPIIDSVEYREDGN